MGEELLLEDFKQRIVMISFMVFFFKKRPSGYP